MEALATFRVRMSEADTKEDILMDLMRADLNKNPVNDERGVAVRTASDLRHLQVGPGSRTNC
jgi:hypothetical protein